MSEQVDIIQDDDGDLLLVFETGRYIQVSSCGRPATGRRSHVLSDDEIGYLFLEKVPADRAKLMTEHGCTHTDLDLDQMIWATVYAKKLAPSIRQRITGSTAAEYASKQADRAVLARWKAKGKA